MFFFFFSGTVDPKPSDLLHGPLNDHNRIKFLKDHLSELSDSIRLVHSILYKEREIKYMCVYGVRGVSVFHVWCRYLKHTEFLF